MTIAIIDSGGANIASIQFALDRLNQNAELTADPDVIARAPQVILPGVGAAQDAMQSLKAKDGLIDCIRSLTQPVLGICLGMQLLFTESEESTESKTVPLLKIIEGTIEKFNDQDGLIIPHMGWNSVNLQNSRHPLLHNCDDNSYFYFVHSYKAAESKHTLGLCHYGQNFTAITAKDNFMGCQFHPERSGHAGSTILQNFCNM